MKVAIYARRGCRQPVSNRLAAQIESLRTWAAANEHAVVEEHLDDGYSGTTLDRPGLQAIREAAAAGGFEGVAATDPYRFTRVLEDLDRLVEELGASGVRVLFPEIS
jgi:site-specific DNA recombinase